jgi:hypothetical protein
MLLENTSIDTTAEFIQIMQHDYLQEMLYEGYDVNKHTKRALKLLELAYDLCMGFADTEKEQCEIEVAYRNSISVISQSCQFFKNDTASEFEYDENEKIGIFLAHGSSGLHETTLLYFPILRKLISLYQRSTDLVQEQLGFATLEQFGLMFLQNLPPLFVADTVINQGQANSQLLTRTFISPIDLLSLRSEDELTQTVGWLTSLVYVVESLQFLLDRGYRIFGGGGLIPLLTSHGTFSRVRKFQKYHKRRVIFRTVERLPQSKNLLNMMGLSKQSCTQIHYIYQLQGYLLLSSITKKLEMQAFAEMEFTSGHTGTAVLILETVLAVIEENYERFDNPIKVGVLGAGGSIARAALGAISAVVNTNTRCWMPNIVFHLYDISKEKLAQTYDIIQNLGTDCSIVSSFNELVKSSDIIISAITVLTEEMKEIIDYEYEQKLKCGDCISVFQRKIFIEDTYPSLLPIEKLQSLGATVVLVLAQEGNHNLKVCREAIPYHSGLYDAETQSPIIYTYGLESESDKMVDYGCGAELFTNIWLSLCNRQELKTHSGPTQLEMIKQLRNLWHSEEIVTLAPLQDGCKLS